MTYILTKIKLVFYKLTYKYPANVLHIPPYYLLCYDIFMGHAQIIDTNIFHDYVGNDESQIEFMIDLFTEQSSTYFSELEIAYIHDDQTEWHDVAHKLKGMALFTGAHQLYKTCKTAQDNHECAKQEKLILLHTIEKDIEQAVSFFKNYQGNT